MTNSAVAYCEGAEGWTVTGGKNGDIKGPPDISRLLVASKMQSALGADNPRTLRHCKGPPSDPKIVGLRTFIRSWSISCIRWIAIIVYLVKVLPTAFATTIRGQKFGNPGHKTTFKFYKHFFFERFVECGHASSTPAAAWQRPW